MAVMENPLYKLITHFSSQLVAHSHPFTSSQYSNSFCNSWLMAKTCVTNSPCQSSYRITTAHNNILQSTLSCQHTKLHLCLFAAVHKYNRLFHSHTWPGLFRTVSADCWFENSVTIVACSQILPQSPFPHQRSWFSKQLPSWAVVSRSTFSTAMTSVWSCCHNIIFQTNHSFTM